MSHRNTECFFTLYFVNGLVFWFSCVFLLTLFRNTDFLGMLAHSVGLRLVAQRSKDSQLDQLNNIASIELQNIVHRRGKIRRRINSELVGEGLILFAFCLLTSRMSLNYIFKIVP